MMRTEIAVAVALLVSPLDAFAAPTIVDTCGQSYGGSGVLAADRDCTGFALPSVHIDSPGGKLDLDGFTITGGSVGVSCNAGCTVFSSSTQGTILDSDGRGISAHGEKVTIENIPSPGAEPKGSACRCFPLTATRRSSSTV